MRWKYYIASCLRLVDLVQSRHEPGTAPNFVKAEPGRSDALWLDLGIGLLDFLRESAIETGNDFVSISPFMEATKKSQPNLVDEDFQYICNLLSNSSVFHFPVSLENRIVQVGETALIERLSTSRKQYRLTPVGRLAVELAGTTSEWAYSDEDAQKILKALDLEDYPKALQFSEELRARMISFSHDLRRALEQPGYEELKSDFVKFHEAYEKILENVQKACLLALDRVSTATFEESMEQWALGRDIDLESYHLRRSFQALNRCLELLSRNFASLLSAVANRQRESVGIIDFSKLSLAFLRKPPSPKMVLELWEKLGPCQPEFTYATSADLQGCLKIQLEEKTNKGAVFHEEGIETVVPDALERLLERHGREMSEELLNGPVSLKTALEKGWFEVDSEVDGLALLVGVYTLPERLKLPFKKLCVGRLGEPIAFETNEGHLTGDNIALIALDNKEALGV